jgi:hypothetical protein
MYRPPPSSLTSSLRVFLPLDLLGVPVQPQHSQWLVVAAGGLVCEFLFLLASLVHRCAGSPDCGGVLAYICVSGPYGLCSP